MAQRSYWVDILASRTRALYVGVTNNLTRRLVERGEVVGSAFTRRYRAHRLVHAEEFADVRDAIRREKTLKGWTRARKLAQIEETNPAWDDLATGR